MMYIKKLVLAVGLAITNANLVYAADEGLYGAEIPKDAVFIRWLGEADPSEREVFGFDFTGKVSGTGYVVISATLLDDVASGSYFTVVEDAQSEFKIIAEPQRSSVSKVNLILLNGTHSVARIVVAGGGPEVIGDVASGNADLRAVNPVSINLTVEASDRATSFEVSLKRGQDLTFAVLNDGISLVPTVIGAIIAEE